MTISRSEDLFVGLVALALAPFVLLRIVRGLRDGRLPLYRTQVIRSDSAAKFNVLLLLHAVALALMVLVAADLLLALGLRNAL